jgi:hypothetical protein
MAIYQRREAGVWYADFYANGKREQVSTGTKNKREAEKFFALRVSETERGEFSRPRFPSSGSSIWSMRKPTNDHGSGTNR